MLSASTAPILIVNAAAAVRDALARALRKEGYEVVVAADAAEAVELLRNGLHPCLILIDLHLPDVDGFEFRRRQLKVPAFADLPLVFYGSGRGQPPESRLIDTIGVDWSRLGLDKVLQVVEDHCEQTET